MKRRTFLQTGAVGLASISLASLQGCSKRTQAYLQNPQSGFYEPNHAVGHRLRGMGAPLPPVSDTQRTPILIVGGGVAGLSAAWQLARSGMKDFTLLELEPECGGNARGASSSVTRYPLGAHYLPLPAQRAVYVRHMLKDLGVLKGDPLAAAPVYDEIALVSAPIDRLFINGVWQEGLVPRRGFSKEAVDQFTRFDELMHQWAQRIGRDGKPAFVVPSALSSTDPEFQALDQVPFTKWLLAQGFTAEPVHWVANYATRDDYGLAASQTSAWAGIHYFASRIGRAANANDHSVLTWPAGNGHLISLLEKWLAQQQAGRVLKHSMAFAVNTQDGETTVGVYNAEQDRTTRWTAQHVIWAAPTFVLARVWQNPVDGFKQTAVQIQTRPWLVVNLHLNAPLTDELHGYQAWDNVVYGGRGLGYVVATHQAIRTFPGPTVLTYYWPFGEGSAQEARKQLYESDWQTWAQAVVQELSIPHPELPKFLNHVQVTRWAHAMPAPVVGYRTLLVRQLLEQLHPRLHMAHSDVSGLSLFEEANYTAVNAASKALTALGLKAA